MIELRGEEDGFVATLGEFGSLMAAYEWINDEDAHGGVREGVELYCRLPDGERIYLDHDDKWIRRVETDSYSAWRTLCQQRGLSVSEVEARRGVYITLARWVARDENGVQCGHYASGRGCVEVRLTDEEVSRER